MRVGSSFGWKLKLGAMLAISVAAWPVVAHSDEPALLDTLRRGGWDLRIRDDGSHQKICLRDGREFIQLRHRQPGCSQFVVEDKPGLVTIQYTCRGNGYGRTTVRRETDELVQIESQGIFNGVPFSFRGEGRYAGAC